MGSDSKLAMANYQVVFLVPRHHDLVSLDRSKDSPDLVAMLNSFNHLKFIISIP